MQPPEAVKVEAKPIKVRHNDVGLHKIVRVLGELHFP
jgi:hypothetical protein